MAAVQEKNLSSEQISGNVAAARLLLTPRQEEIHRMLRQGMSNKMIAGTLGISEGTVKNHITDILRVLNATNRTQAARHGSAMFDIEEYLHLAIHASSVGNHHACMTYLKEVLQQQPEHATALYLLAIQHAELGLPERAISGLEAALAIKPELEIARFQLGMLLVDRKRTAEAKAQLAALTGSRDPALRAYSEAMIALADNNRKLVREKLAVGLSHPAAIPALSVLMRRIHDSLATSHPAAVSKPAATGEQFFLGAYRNTVP
jgi:DNA-binding CsgD family transcriptional regulator